MKKQDFLNKIKKENKLKITEPSEDIILTKISSKEMILKAERFLVQMKFLITELKTEEIEQIRKKFKSIITQV